jgi:response regulator of citrate/malate metabolism
MSSPNHIIFIDDDPMFNFIHSRVISSTKLNIVVKIFDNVSAAITELNELDLNDVSDFRCTIFVDINMPVHDGWQFLEKFSVLSQAFKERCEVYMLSSSNDLSDIEKSRTFPVVKGFISKPLTARQVLDIYGS